MDADTHGGLTRRTLLERAVLAGVAAEALDPSAALAALARRRSTGRARATFGTELEYYRSDPAHLEVRLAACKAAGYSTIQTYVPWNVHENTRGRLDFTGRSKPVIVSDHWDEYQIETPDQEVSAAGLPSRVIANTDLIGYLKACARHGFKVILRPGPFISDEWRSGGLPDWLAIAYPQMFMRGPHGSALEPGFPFSPPLGVLTGGGPLFYFAGPSYASEDYLRESRRWLTRFVEAVRPFLKSNGGPVVSMQVDDEICFYYRFGPFEVDYHPSMVKRFGSAPPTDWPAPGGPVRALRAALHWQRFKAEQLAAWLREMADTLRAAGVKEPISHEHEQQLSPPANFSRLAQAVDVLHPEFYLDPSAYTVPTIELCAAAIRAAQRNRRDVISAEMSGGDVLVRHLLTGEGIKGFLGFTYTEGINDSDIPAMNVLGRALRLAGPRLARSDRAADTAIVWPTEYLYAPYESTRYGFQHDVRNAIESDIPALATLLIRAGLAFDVLDTDVAQPADYRSYRTIWLACADVLPRSCQRALVSYVRRGGKLICWPAPPTLDEEYAPCTLLRDALYPERLGPSYAQDSQTINVHGHPVQVWRGVQTFALSSAAKPVAMRGRQVCGYSRRVGSGHAVLLGTWPVADSIPGREGDAFATQDAPFSVAIPRPPGAGEPQTLIVFDYSNQRRGGEVLTGGVVSYWDGENVVPISGVNLANTLLGTAVSRVEVSAPPFRPITESHLRMAHALHGHAPVCAVSDRHVQARLLRARDSAAATVSVVNRYSVDATFAIRAAGRRLPSRGKMTLPGGAALLLPIDYQLGRGVVVEQATVQILDAQIGRHAVQLTVTSPSGGEIVLRLSGGRGRRTIHVRPGEQTVRLAWRR